MKRSEINRTIGWAEALLQKRHISLPDYASWSPKRGRPAGTTPATSAG